MADNNYTYFLDSETGEKSEGANGIASSINSKTIANIGINNFKLAYIWIEFTEGLLM